MSGAPIVFLLLVIRIALSSNAIVDLLSGNLVLCYRDFNPIPEISVKNDCNTSKWVSHLDCKSCINEGGVFCKSDTSEEYFCASLETGCDSEYVALNTTTKCPCNKVYLSGSDCTTSDCGKNGVFVPKTGTCKCNPGWSGKTCDVCAKTSSSGLSYICCNFGGDKTKFHLLAPQDNQLHRFLSGSYNSAPCVYPGTKIPGLYTLSCDCSNPFAKKGNNSATDIPDSTSNVQFLTNHISTILEGNQNYTSPENIAYYVSQTADSKIYNATVSRRINSSTSPTSANHTGIAVLAVVCTFVAMLLIIFLIYFIVTCYNTQRKREMEEEKVPESQLKRRISNRTDKKMKQ